MSNADHQRKYRERQAKEGRREVRGIYAPEHLHEQIKRYARQLTEQAKSTT